MSNDIPEQKNAKITSTMLGVEDHGIMTCFLHLDYHGGGHSAGGYGLDSYRKDLDRRTGTAEGMELIARILTVVGVEKWEDLPGKHVRVRASWNKVHAIGNILKEDWLDFEEFFKNPFPPKR